MSAWIVSKEHIDALVTGLVESEIVVGVSRDEIGRVLWRENLASVAYRYPNDRDGERPGPLDFHDSDVDTYTHTPNRISQGSLYQQALCYFYQSCEHPGWTTSAARRWVEELIDGLERAGYDREHAEVNRRAVRPVMADVTSEEPHLLTVEATPGRWWSYRWRCSCGHQGSADSHGDAAMKHRDHIVIKGQSPACPRRTVGGTC